MIFSQINAYMHIHGNHNLILLRKYVVFKRALQDCLMNITFPYLILKVERVFCYHLGLGNATAVVFYPTVWHGSQFLGEWCLVQGCLHVGGIEPYPSICWGLQMRTVDWLVDIKLCCRTFWGPRIAMGIPNRATGLWSPPVLKTTWFRSFQFMVVKGLKAVLKVGVHPHHVWKTTPKIMQILIIELIRGVRPGHFTCICSIDFNCTTDLSVISWVSLRKKRDLQS